MVALVDLSDNERVELLGLGFSEEQMAHYRRCRANGTGHKLAVILAGQQAPGMDRTDERLARPNEEARARGIKGGSYHPGLARFPNDPRAVVRSRGDAQKIVNAEGGRLTKEPAPDNATSNVQTGTYRG